MKSAAYGVKKNSLSNAQAKANAIGVAAQPRIVKYRKSKRCQPFNQMGIFRSYRELYLPAGRSRA